MIKDNLDFEWKNDFEMAKNIQISQIQLIFCTKGQILGK